MDLEYDQKFEEMKQYIPFLESMIKRLENTSCASANPRQAQLDKIRSLRDLLLDKKKRMKMENLLKCEQVLVNLYAKVEQRDTLPGIKKVSDSTPDTSKDKTDLINSARNKLKTVVSKTKLVEQAPETLPEIARANETEVTCTGSKEPALFQRRPHKLSDSQSQASPTKSENKSPQKSVPKRGYTRVLKSPEPGPRRWTTAEDPPSDKQLFSRRSPRRSPRRPSPSYNKREWKKSSSESHKNKSKDLNITLKVPEESLNSLNTVDIVDRIINCNDNDVDIDTLRDLRTQILGELKQTGASEDISDLIMKSYKKKKYRKGKEKAEIEEGELSDSESEAIENIYSSLVLGDKDKSTMSETKVATEEDKQSRKINIKFVFNTDKRGTSIDKGKHTTPAANEQTDFEMIDFSSLSEKTKQVETKETSKEKEVVTNKTQPALITDPKLSIKEGKTSNSQEIITLDDEDEVLKKTDETISSGKNARSSNDICNSSNTDKVPETISEKVEPKTSKTVPFKPNFYKPLTEQESVETSIVQTENKESQQEAENKRDRKEENKNEELQTGTKKPVDIELRENMNLEVIPSQTDKNVAASEAAVKDSKALESNVDSDPRENVEIPLLNLEPIVPAPKKNDTVSEIDILQALKNEILSESLTLPGSETVTPALHQPKLTKVASCQEIMSKKRISIEKYKEKSSTTTKSSVFLKDPTISKEDNFKKQSLKLTEKECERFNFPAKLALDESSDEEEKTAAFLDDIYGDLAPKSPENDDTNNSENTGPIIIPVDPVKNTVNSSIADVDMRQLVPILSPTVTNNIVSPALSDVLSQVAKNTNKPEQFYKPPLVDPRVRRDLNKQTSIESPNPLFVNERPGANYPNMTPSRTPSMTPNMTPNARTYDLTPSQSIDVDENSSHKHVYAPIFPFESRDHREKSVTRENPMPHWEPHSEVISEGRRIRWESADNREGNNSGKWEEHGSRGTSIQRDCAPDYAKSRYNDSSDKYNKKSKNDRYSYDKRDEYPYSRLECPRTPVHSFGRSDCPATPTPSFGRLDAPMTPVPLFGRSDCPATPNHPFGRADCSPTPTHPFGRNDAPMTPSHPFGRSECPMTPSHPFGRSEVPLTPSHPFGRSEILLTPSHAFGRSEAPMTPNHSFGRSDAPMTPSHSFGRSDAPMTPSHPFGRSEINAAPMTPSHPFGRSDYSQGHSNSGGKFVKDPRLNRSNDYESISNSYEDDRDLYYKDRRKSDRPYKASDSYRNYGREHSVGGNERSYDNSGRYNREPPRRETSMSRDYDADKLYTRERGRGRSNNDYRYDTDSMNYNESRRNYQRAQSGGQTIDEKYNRQTNRNYQEDVNNEKTLSVKPQSGRSFTIDTSVNRTFQEFLNGKGMQVFDYSFDNRRQRAASVGRSLVRETSVGRTFRESSVGRTLTSSATPSSDSSGLRNRRNFTRARSMGRDMAEYKQDKSFKDIKAEFEIYSANSKRKDSKQITKSNEKISGRDPRSRKEIHDIQQNKKSYPTNIKTAYSPRKNYRDPRLRREQQSDSNKYRNDRENRDRKNYGIVYSNDNIARGAILGSGYGVKNYKIPKIKRATEDKEDTEEKDKADQTDIKGDSKIIDKKDLDIKATETMSTFVEKEKKRNKDTKQKADDKKEVDTNISNKSTISNKKTKSTDKNIDAKLTQYEAAPFIATRSKRGRKCVIYDSDTESSCGNQENKDIDNSESLNVNKESITKKYESVKTVEAEENDNKKQDDLLDPNFGMDDIEIFPDNINALIADLDNDIDDSKNDKGNQFTNEISLENMFDSINSTEEKNLTVEESIKELTDLINETDSKPQQKSPAKKLDLDQKENSELQVVICDNEVTKDEKQTNEKCVTPSADVKDSLQPSNKSVEVKIDQLSSTQRSVVDDVKVNNDAIVSTTDIDKEVAKTVEAKLQEQVDDNNMDRSSTPDSTINTNESVQQTQSSKDLPDSTNEIQNDSDITSTHDSAETSNINAKTSASCKDNVSQIGSFENLLSILQHKSKIKELLSLLGENSAENEKIKKKLEKLSEIVSDDEDSNDVVDQNETATKEEQETSNNTVEIKSVEKTGDNSKEIESFKETNDNTVEVKTIEKTTNVCDDKTEPMVEEVVNKSLKEKDKSEETIEDDADNLDDAENTDQETELATKTSKPRKKQLMKRTRRGKAKMEKKTIATKGKRVTRSDVANARSGKPRASRELRLLQEDIKEMFISDEILNSTGIRMCRLAKLVDDKNSNQEELAHEIKPVVMLEKFKEKELLEDKVIPEKVRKKPGPKPKSKVSVTDTSGELEDEKSKPPPKYKPGPKSKTRPSIQEMTDPYSFESDSVSEKSTNKTGENVTSSDSESDSLASYKSFGSSEALAELKKKPKRKRRGWQAGVIKAKKRKKVESKPIESSLDDKILVPPRKITIPDLNCFTDKTYCFLKNVSTYSCRLCEFSGSEIVHHYKMLHPHSEIPLSRMNRDVAREAIEQCEEVNFQAISKIPSDKYVCRFCFKEFGGKRKSKAVLETFFWHVVSTHTGEYKQLCCECMNVTPCPFNLDIPAPPKNVKGQLIGYICGKCNFTQISLENLKTHVIVQHNDEQTEVYTINLAVMTRKTINTLMKRCNITEQPRVLRSSRSNQSVAETSDDRSDITESTDHLSETDSVRRKSLNESVSFAIEASSIANIQRKITFENEDNASNTSNFADTKATFKMEKDENEEDETSHFDENLEPDNRDSSEEDTEVAPGASDDIVDIPHFKISFTDSGAKEYVCCINGNDNHYKTSLIISMKRHVQTKHPENWDGYCYVCKLIVTTQGEHLFKECLQHFLDKHIDNFPVLNQTVESTDTVVTSENISIDEPNNVSIKTSSSKSYINVRPLSELVSKDAPPKHSSVALPKIQSVMSLGATIVEPPSPVPSSTSPAPDTKEIQKLTQALIAATQEKTQVGNTATTQDILAVKVSTPIPKLSPIPEKQFKYEEAQAEIMSKKHQVVLDTMLAKDKLVKIFKCAGRYCYFTTDSADEALVHASTHQRIGGENALICAYCDFDCSGNYIDLVTHVFNNHGCCPFVCGHCFYRAAASQLVRAHMLRVHGEEAAQGVVLKTATVTPSTAIDGDLLTRDKAVQYYVCNDVESNCKFRIFTHGKFHEHLLKHHAPYTCYICSEACPSPAELINHMKVHEIKLYQCTWCVHGAENETELLAHASTRHPHKQPQAYLRIITSKDGSNKRMVLPLAQYNRSTVPTELVTPPPSNEHPAREAERSIQLENLIASVTSPSFAAVESPTQEHPATSSESVLETESQEPPRLVTPPPVVNKDDISQQLTPVLKKEPETETPVKTDESNSEVIYCLDSDDEDSRPSVIDLSDDEAPSSQKDPVTDQTYVKIPHKKLYICPKPFCNSLYVKPATFRKHIFSCIPQDGKVPCAHCPLIVTTREALIRHYEKDHRPPSKADKNSKNDNRYVCGICELKGNTLMLIKTHIRSAHGVTNLVVVSNYLENGDFIYTVRESPQQQTQQKPRPKRKLSGGSASDRTPKKKRYGPEDVDQLPTKPILDELVYCALCEFNSKVRLNVVRHLQCHAEMQPVPQTVPVNPVPHLETNEKHFDKMVNLASSSIVTRAPDKQTKGDSTPAVTLVIPPEAASRYPKYVPERQRHTCGAKGCSYISVDEAMLKCHWETLHSGTNDYHCVHCPPYQHLDTSKPLTASRIIAHLKMHDVQLYACSSCSYYHYKRQVLDKHLTELHKGVGQVMVVREEYTTPPPAGQSQPTVPAPTMDLKAWQCGLCKFKSMLRQEVVEHCAKVHSSKMQYKCPNCPFRTSTLENVTKHKTNSHPDSTEEVIFYYYREGSIPDEADGTPLWLKQRQKTNTVDTEVKTELPDNSIPSTPMQIPPIAPPVVDLNLVKKEVVEPEIDESIEELCKKFGQFCDPNGLKYKCPFCKVVVEDTKEAMQSHLYEELKYRKWGCSICSYKAFHKTGLNEHMAIEHRQNRDPIELPLDARVEKWVFKLLEHQAAAIEKTKENFAKQRIQVEKRPVPSTSMPKEKPTEMAITKTLTELVQAFGPLGEGADQNFCCPKCDFKTKDQAIMQDHLESELNRIRWLCSNCSDYFQEYHEAQLHCKSVHMGRSARPVEALRDPAIRAAWVAAVLRTQKQSMNIPDSPTKTADSAEEKNIPPTIENPLLVVRYEERVPTPEEEMLVRRKRPAPTSVTPDSDDERLVIDEPTDERVSKKKGTDWKKCPHCDFTTKYPKSLNDHVLKHYNLKSFKCSYCEFTCGPTGTTKHAETQHPDLPRSYVKVKVPSGPPLVMNVITRHRRPLSRSEDEAPKTYEAKKDDAPKVICLICEKSIPETECSSHTHGATSVNFAKKGDVVVKCCICLGLFLNVSYVQEHNASCHPNTKLNYAFFKIHYDTREIHECGHCDKRFTFLRDLKSHHYGVHSSLQLKYNSKPFTPGNLDLVEGDDDERVVKRKCESPMKRVAKKSTTKLPSQSVAKKSTTKLPVLSQSDSESDDEYSYYGTKPTSPDDLAGVTLTMPFCNKMMPFTLKKFNELVKIDPMVVVKDIKK